jgi:hypothetical protein
MDLLPRDPRLNGDVKIFLANLDNPVNGAHVDHHRIRLGWCITACVSHAATASIHPESRGGDHAHRFSDLLHRCGTNAENCRMRAGGVNIGGYQLQGLGIPQHPALAQY